MFLTSRITVWRICHLNEVEKTFVVKNVATCHVDNNFAVARVRKSRSQLWAINKLFSVIVIQVLAIFRCAVKLIAIHPLQNCIVNCELLTEFFNLKIKLCEEFLLSPLHSFIPFHLNFFSIVFHTAEVFRAKGRKVFLSFTFFSSQELHTERWVLVDVGVGMKVGKNYKNYSLWALSGRAMRRIWNAWVVKEGRN